jgi:peroxiredoxin
LHQLTLVIISKGLVEENQGKFDDYAIEHILLQRESEVADAYQIPWTPGAILVKPDGTIASHVAYGSEQIQNLVAHVTNLTATEPWVSQSVEPQSEAEPPKPAIGDAAPSFTLADINGKPIELRSLFTNNTLLLFWNPTCSFCQAMLDKVKDLQAARVNGAPRIVIISRGTAEALLPQGLHAPILLDDEFKTGKAFGATGTPAAVLIDAQGRIASAVGAGEQAVLALAGAHRLHSANLG